MVEKGIKQGFDKEIFRKAVKVAAGLTDFVQVQIFDAIVQYGSQDENSMTCVVDSVDSTLSNLTVRYNLCISDGEINVPEDGSTVTIAKTAFTDPYIVKSTDLKSKLISIGNQTYLNDGEIQSFDFYQDAGVEGSFGGFIKLKDPENVQGGVLKRLNNIEDDINNLKTDFSNLLISVNALSAALTALNAAPAVPVVNSVLFSTLDPFVLSLISTLTPYSINTIIPTISSDIENEHITHGIKNKS